MGRRFRGLTNILELQVRSATEEVSSNEKRKKREERREMVRPQKGGMVEIKVRP